MPWFVKRDASSLADGASDGPSPAGGASCRDDGTCEASVQGSVLATLEDLATALQRDVFEDAAKEWRAFVSNDSKKLLRDDDENIADRGKWEQLNFARNGVWVPEESDLGDLRPYFVETQRRLREMLATAADRLPKGSVEISVLWPGSHLAAHSGPSNHRLCLHLVLAGGGPGCKLRVGDSANAKNAVEYHAGQVLAFDDAFDHEVWNDSQEAHGAGL
ncbi:Aspartyl/Asparaginyl beta-hydroxylase-domain-containing protein [Pelagophyceae sp. CCMP2097]|nr:Aspartyl/Asparaginyl beta-hydroxylase-domain-containing protein [Pelagophyceae sp. CCMP2097]